MLNDPLVDFWSLSFEHIFHKGAGSHQNKHREGLLYELRNFFELAKSFRETIDLWLHALYLLKKGRDRVEMLLVLMNLTHFFLVVLSDLREDLFNFGLHPHSQSFIFHLLQLDFLI